MNVVNKETLEHLGVNKHTVEWFVRNIGELPVSLIKSIEGNYIGDARNIRGGGVKGILLLNYITHEYNEFGLPTKGKSKLNGDTFIRTYDSQGNNLTYERGKDFKTVKVYGANNRLIKATAVLKGKFTEVSEYTYDDYGNGLTYTNSRRPDFNWVKTYDENNNMVTYENEDNINTYTRDTHGNVIDVTDTTGFNSQRTFDKDNNMLSYVDSNGLKIQRTYDNNGNCIAYHNSKKEDGYTKVFDNNNNMVEYHSASGYSLHLTLDELNRVISKKDNKNLDCEYTYDHKGNILTMQDITKPDKSWSREYIKTDEYFLQKLNGEDEIKVYLW